MTDYTLKFPDEATATAVLESLQATHAIDVIGTISKPTGKTLATEEGPQPVLAPVPGWHVNVRGPEVEALDQYHIEVATPERVWA
jgi:hypothetical protein